MRSLDVQVLARVVDWLQSGTRVWLCTIVDTWGSSPRPIGSMLAVNAAGQWAGSVSGGCLEEDLIRRFTEETPETAAPSFVDYGVTDADKSRFQLPCGGQIRLLIEPLSGDVATAHMVELVEHLERREPVTRVLSLSGAAPVLQAATLAPGVLQEGSSIYHTLGPRTRMLLIGAGEVSRFIARFAAASDFDVTVCEPRETFLNGWDEPGIETLQVLPDDLIRKRFQDRYCAILALAHDPRVDDMALLEAFRSSAFYIGAMGSQRTSAARRERLFQLGVDRNAMTRLHAPIGFNIGSKTPAEIAISAMAQVVAERYRLLVRNVPRPT